MKVLGLLALAGIALRLLSPLPVHSQSVAFDVASVKRSLSNGNARTIQVDAGSVRIRGMSLRDLILRAYGRGHALQVTRLEAVDGGPKWSGDDLFDIDAKPGDDPNGSAETLSTRLQALLTERFHLAFHHETREAAGFQILLARDGSKLRERHPGDGGESRVLGRLKRGQNGEVHVEMRDASAAAIAAYFGNVFDTPVADRTGLGGTFDLDLDWTPDESQFGGRYAAAAADSTMPGLFAALREQCGLRLESARVAVDVMVIDRAERME